MRRAAKTDESKAAIVEAIEAEGWEVFDIRLPCDIVCWHPVLDVLQWMELKTAKPNGKPRTRNDQPEQAKFLARTSCPIVTTPEEALEVLSRHYPSDVARPDLVLMAKRIRDEFERAWKARAAA